MSGGKPRPRNDRVDSAMIADETSIVPATMTGPIAFGRMWRITCCQLRRARAERAASTNSFSRSERNCARTRRATGIQRKPADDEDDQDEDAALEPEDRLQLRRGTGR